MRLFVQNMSQKHVKFRLCVLFSLIVTFYGVRRWEELRSLKLSLSLESGCTKRQPLKALICLKEMLPGCGEATRRRTSLLDEKGRTDIA